MVVKKEYNIFLEQAHEEIQKFYRESELDYLPTAEQRSHAEFDAKAGDRPVTRRIAQIHRVRVGGKKDNVYFCEHHTSHDHRGNEISKYVINGKYEKPIGQYEFDEFRGVTRCLGIARLETVYQISFDTKMFDDMFEKGEIDMSTQYYVETVGGRMYGGFEYEDFRSLSFDDLVYLGKTGNRPGEKEIEVKTKRPTTGLKE